MRKIGCQSVESVIILKQNRSYRNRETNLNDMVINCTLWNVNEYIYNNHEKRKIRCTHICFDCNALLMMPPQWMSLNQKKKCLHMWKCDWMMNERVENNKTWANLYVKREKKIVWKKGWNCINICWFEMLNLIFCIIIRGRGFKKKM